MWPHRWQPTRANPWDSLGENPSSLGFSRQEHWRGCHFLLQRMKVKSESEVSQSWPTLSDLMDCSPPGSSIHMIFQTRVLEWVAIAFSMEQQTASKMGKEYNKAVYWHHAYLTYMQSIPCKMPGWMKCNLDSRLPGEISITSEMQIFNHVWQNQ